jgi:probable HAF family extracellular repeat protein
MWLFDSLNSMVRQRPLGRNHLPRRFPRGSGLRPLRLEQLEHRCLLSYSITDLGTLSGPSGASYAYGINDSGQAVGYSNTVGGQAHAFRYNGTPMQDLGTLGGSMSQANAINSFGQVAGNSTTAGDQVYHAFLYDGVQMEDLGTIGPTNSWGTGINDSAQVVGYYHSSIIGDDHPFLYDGTTMYDIGSLGASSGDGRANGINSSGQVVGWSMTVDGQVHAFLYDGTVMHDLGTLGSSISQARAINDSGQVVGYSYTPSGVYHAFLDDGAGMQDLGTLAGGNFNSSADSINSAGQVVGVSQTLIGPMTVDHAFLYDGAGIHDLNDMIPSGTGWTLVHATGINTQGQIVGWGDINDHPHAYLLTPLDSPGAGRTGRSAAARISPAGAAASLLAGARQEAAMAQATADLNVLLPAVPSAGPTTAPAPLSQDDSAISESLTSSPRYRATHGGPLEPPLDVNSEVLDVLALNLLG